MSTRTLIMLIVALLCNGCTRGEQAESMEGDDRQGWIFQTDDEQLMLFTIMVTSMTWLSLYCAVLHIPAIPKIPTAIPLQEQKKKLYILVLRTLQVTGASCGCSQFLGSILIPQKPHIVNVFGSVPLIVLILTCAYAIGAWFILLLCEEIRKQS